MFHIYSFLRRSASLHLAFGCFGYVSAQLRFIFVAACLVFVRKPPFCCVASGDIRSKRVEAARALFRRLLEYFGIVGKSMHSVSGDVEIGV